MTAEGTGAAPGAGPEGPDVQVPPWRALPPSLVAARRDRSSQPSYTLRHGRAYPPAPPVADPEATASQLQATRALLQARTARDVVDVVHTFVHDLGGAIVPARLGGAGTTLPVDVSLGLSEPLLVVVDDLSIGAMRLEGLLTSTLEDARTAVARLAPTRAEPLETHPGTAVADYLDTVRDVDAEAACGLVVDLLQRGQDIGRVTREVLAPAQVEVGRLWQQGHWSIADEHAATAVTDRALSALAGTVDRRGRARRTARSGQARRDRHVLVACAQGEWHSLPARLAGAVASSTGVRVTVLGGSVPAGDLGRRLAAGDVDVLALSCTLTTNLLGALRCIEAAHTAGTPVVAGGHAFGSTPDRAYAIGADGWSDEPGSLGGAAPALRNRHVDVPREVLLLDAADHRLVARAEGLLASADPSPGSGPGPDGQWSRTRTLTDLLRHAAAAVLTGDVGVLSEILQWHGERDTDVLPRRLIQPAALTLADSVTEIAPLGASLLRAAASALPPSG